MDVEDVVERLNEPLPLPDGVKLVMQPTEADAQFLEWQTYLTRKICAIFGVAPSDLPPSQNAHQEENTR